MAPDEILTETRYIIVLRGDPPPQFESWSMDFDFGATSTRAPTRTDRASSQCGTGKLVLAVDHEQHELGGLRGVSGAVFRTEYIDLAP